MKSFVGVLGLLLASVLLASSGKADFILSIASGSEFQANSGIQSVDVFALSNTAATGLSMTADFSLGGGAVFDSPNAGTFGGAGFIGESNINIGSSFLLRNNLGGDPSNAALSIEFIGLQTAPATNTRIATLSINTANLAVGNYAININRTNFGISTGTFTNGSFAITSVPEPGSLLTVALGFGGAWIGRRRLRRS